MQVPLRSLPSQSCYDWPTKGVCGLPVVPGCVMMSSKPPAATATTGSPLAIASRATNPAGPEQEVGAHSACH